MTSSSCTYRQVTSLGKGKFVRNNFREANSHEYSPHEMGPELLPVGLKDDGKIKSKILYFPFVLL